MTKPVAAIDCGSNSTRLLIVEHTGATVTRQMRVTRLSEGVDATGALTPAALERTWAVLAEYHDEMVRRGAREGLLAATSAVRDASNAARFLERSHAITGVETRVLSGEEEAAFTYAGATADLGADERPTLVLDIGGGSTEMALRLDDSLVSYSMQLGCVRVTERALGSGVVGADAERAARAMIAGELDRAFRAEPVFSTLNARVRLVGVAGTVATLAQMDAGAERYDRDVVHHRLLSLEVVRRWRAQLAGEVPEARMAHPGMVRGREDVLHAGLLVLEMVMERLGVVEVISSENDILDGMAAALVAR